MVCLVCHSDSLVERLNVGSHPVSSFYLKNKGDPERNFTLALGQCNECGTIQAMEPVRHESLVPPFDWIFAREPEEHLDEVVEQIIAMPGLGPDSVIGALTEKDDTTVDRFVRNGFENTWRVKLDEDLGVTDPAAGIETVQKLTDPERMAVIAARRGAADIFIARHITEHVEDMQAFIGGIGALVKPGGIVMIEVPDCTDSLRLAEYCMIWEEHSLYLTPETLEPLVTIGGFETIRTDIYRRPFENSLVHLARKTGAPGKLRISSAAKNQVGLLDSYARKFQPTRREVRTTLERVRSEQGPIALFGAGHLACAFVNYFGVSDLIEFVADDSPHKQGKFLPGSRLPILPSADLVGRGIKLCLLALSINNEDGVIGRQGAFTAVGGEFRSIFRASSRPLISQ